MNISVIGTGYVGLTTGICFAELGNNVICMDIDKEKINKLANGIATFYEPGLEEMLSRNLNSKLQFTTDLKEAVDFAEVIFIAVGTPTDKQNVPDIKTLMDVVKDISTLMVEKKTIVIKSTVPVGTCKKVADKISKILKERNIQLEFEVVSNPEFLRQGSAINDFLKPDRIIIGISDEKNKKVEMEAGKDIAKVVNDDVDKEINNDVDKDVDKDINNDVDKDVENDVIEEVAKEVEKDVIKDTDKNVDKDTSKDVEEAEDKDIEKVIDHDNESNNRGYNENAKEIMGKLYSFHTSESKPYIVTNLETSEMIKYAANAFLATKVSYINELAIISELYDVDIKTVAIGMGLDARIGNDFLKPGPGYGGSCFPKDTKALLHIGKLVGHEPKIVKATIMVNNEQIDYINKKIKRLLNKIKGKTITILGVAFKSDTDDLREAPSIPIIQKLLKNKAFIKIYDPKAMENCKKIIDKVTYCENSIDACKDSDCIVVLTDWPEFKELDFEIIRQIVKTPLVIDTRNIYDPEKIRNAGFLYEGVGTK